MIAPIPIDKTEAVEDFLKIHWRRAEEGRSQEVEHFYKLWDKAYRAIPAQKERNFPWPKSSNMVVPIVRMYVDTVVSRTLNVVFNTRPLVAVSGYPPEIREALEAYLNLKCRQDWNLYELARGSLMRGNKYGTCLTKTFWRTETVNMAQQSFIDDESSTSIESIPVTKYDGPWADHIAFDDWFNYPISANTVDEVLIFFNRLRYPEETARIKGKKLGMSEDEIEIALGIPSDAKRQQEQQDTGIDDGDYREMHLIECHFDWDVQGSRFPVVALFEPHNQMVVDLQISGIPPHIKTFHAYRPFPRDDVFQGESMAQILGAAQEEVSAIHNDRRNLSVMAAAPIILKKQGARIPGAGHNVFYPGKVFDLEDMDDFRVEKIGGNYQEMIAEENQTLGLIDQVSGISASMRSSSQGGSDKKGVYNAQGTMAMMAEGNQRQDTNIKDFRLYLGSVIKSMFALQREINPQDPAIAQLPREMHEKVMQAMEMSTPEMLARSLFEVRVSDAAMNREARKSNLMTMANTLSQFAQQQSQIAQAAVNPTLNPVLKQVAMETLQMQHGIAKALLSEFDLHGQIEDLPNAKRAIEQSGGMGQPQQAGPQPGVAGPPPIPGVGQ